MRPARLVATGALLLLVGAAVAALAAMTIVALPLVIALEIGLLALVVGVGSHLRSRARLRRRRPPPEAPRDGPVGTAPGWVTGWEETPSPEFVPLVRERVTDALAGWGVTGESAEPALLVVTELLSNAVDHGRGPVRVEVTPAGGTVRVEVRDGSPEAPVLRPPDPRRERGRGMQMVEAVSDRWGWTADGDGKVVWADVRTAWPD